MPETTNEFGDIKISQDVLITYISDTVLSVDGVFDLGSNFQAAIQKNILGKDSSSRGVKITENKEDGVMIDIFVIVKFGTKIPDIAWNIQKQVTDKLNDTVQLPIKEINIHIQGVHLEKDK